MRLTTIALAALLIAAPAIAQTAAPASDTVKAVVEKGVTMEVMGQAGTIEYTPDGKFSGFDGMFNGTYKTDGAKLCISVPDMGLDNQCTAYPDGKKSGDTFEIDGGEVGKINVTIR